VESLRLLQLLSNTSCSLLTLVFAPPFPIHTSPLVFQLTSCTASATVFCSLLFLLPLHPSTHPHLFSQLNFGTALQQYFFRFWSAAWVMLERPMALYKGEPCPPLSSRRSLTYEIDVAPEVGKAPFRCCRAHHFTRTADLLARIPPLTIFFLFWLGSCSRCHAGCYRALRLDHATELDAVWGLWIAALHAHATAAAGLEELTCARLLG
jgi:hypothetical protein